MNMNRKKFIGGMLIIFSVFTTTTYSAENYTTNVSRTDVPQPGLIHEFGKNNCFMTTCNEWGQQAIEAWIGGTFFDAGGTGANGTDFVPGYDPTPSGGYNLGKAFSPFVPMIDTDSNGTLDTRMTGADKYMSASLPVDWVNDLLLEASDPLTVPDESEEANRRDEWIDQIVINYVQSEDGTFAQNFRSQLTFGTSIDPVTGDVTRDPSCASDPAQCFAIIDQRLEQGDTNMENDPSHRVIQAFQQSFQIISGPNTTSNPHINEGEALRWGQMIEQNMEGYFYSCIDCSAPPSVNSFSAPEKALFQAWLVDNPQITSIISNDSSGMTSRLN